VLKIVGYSLRVKPNAISSDWAATPKSLPIGVGFGSQPDPRLLGSAFS